MLRLSGSTSAVMGAGCRLSGCIATLLLVRVELGRGLESQPLLAVMQITLACIVAVLIGNVVKECAFALSEGAMNGLGYPFFRTTRTLSGRVVSETHFPNGTWIRCETWKDGAVWEWTERDGSCTRVESPSMTVVRAAPRRTSKRASSLSGALPETTGDTSRSGRLQSDIRKSVDHRPRPTERHHAINDLSGGDPGVHGQKF